MCFPGVHGWYPLLPPAKPHSAAVSGHTPLTGKGVGVVQCHYVGGVEVCASFNSEKDRELVLAEAEKVGWEPPKLGGPGEEPGGGVEMWEVQLDVVSLTVEKKCAVSASGQAMYCFLRYRFFDLGEHYSLLFHVPCW